MSLGIKLEAVKGLPHGQTGDRVARVIFRGGHDNGDDDDEDDDNSVASN